MSEVIKQDVTIANGAALSSAAPMKEMLLCGIATPASLNSAAAFRFQGSVNGTDFLPVYDEAGTRKSVTIAVSSILLLNPADYAGLTHLKVQTVNASGVDVTQAADVTVILIMRPVV